MQHLTLNCFFQVINISGLQRHIQNAFVVCRHCYYHLHGHKSRNLTRAFMPFFVYSTKKEYFCMQRSYDHPVQKSFSRNLLMNMLVCTSEFLKSVSC